MAVSMLNKVVMDDTTRTGRWFFAIAIEGPIAEKLTELQTRWLTTLRQSDKVRPIIANNLHLTLRFLGPLSDDELSHWQQRSRKICAQSFTLQLANLGYFPRAKTGWIGVKPSTPLTSLAAQLDVSERWQPHISLLRALSADALPELPLPDASWSVNAFYLYHSDGSGTPYQRMQRITLG
ncbi:RNA 2',3'-cyclic phosphodiesterase [Celerinatantimonas yamalensis]|uniref:RNA 2',3'-cyclic phosphodiesterase n=1 Tax=Celerinatantimonas yamalensis TaxID=559956 RepID=A0ABW9GB74_9GAMM